MWPLFATHDAGIQLWATLKSENKEFVFDKLYDELDQDVLEVVADKAVEPMKDPIPDVLRDMAKGYCSRFTLFGRKWHIEQDYTDKGYCVNVYEMLIEPIYSTEPCVSWWTYKSWMDGSLHSQLEVDPTCEVTAHLVRVVAALVTKTKYGGYGRIVAPRTKCGSWSEYCHRFPFLTTIACGC
jgi:hypothetical protein